MNTRYLKEEKSIAAYNYNLTFYTLPIKFPHIFYKD
jgi:hypothetical protein